jgi:hypothetical protein
LRQIDIFLNKHRHFPREEAVQIYCILNRYFYWIQFPVPDFLFKTRIKVLLILPLNPVHF